MPWAQKYQIPMKIIINKYYWGIIIFILVKKRCSCTGRSKSKILPEIKEEDFVDNSDPNEDLYTVHYGTKMPIDAYLCLY